MHQALALALALGGSSAGGLVLVAAALCFAAFLDRMRAGERSLAALQELVALEREAKQDRQTMLRALAALAESEQRPAAAAKPWAAPPDAAFDAAIDAELLLPRSSQRPVLR